MTDRTVHRIVMTQEQLDEIVSRLNRLEERANQEDLTADWVSKEEVDLRPTKSISDQIEDYLVHCNEFGAVISHFNLPMETLFRLAKELGAHIDNNSIDVMGPDGPVKVFGSYGFHEKARK